VVAANYSLATGVGVAQRSMLISNLSSYMQERLPAETGNEGTGRPKEPFQQQQKPFVEEDMAAGTRRCVD